MYIQCIYLINIPGIYMGYILYIQMVGYTRYMHGYTIIYQTIRKSSRQSANAQCQMILVHQVLGWPGVQGGFKLGVEGGAAPKATRAHWVWCDWWLPGRQCAHENALRLRLPQYIDRYACARHCTRGNNCDTTCCSIAKLFNLIQY